MEVKRVDVDNNNYACTICTVVLHYKTLGACLLRTSLLCFHFYRLCYAAVLLNFTYYTQYYAEEQGLMSDYMLVIYNFA